MRIAETVIARAHDGLTAWDKRGVTLDDFLDSISQEPELKSKVASLLFAYFRHRAVIAESISRFSKKTKPALRNLLGLAIAGCWFQDGLRPEVVVDVAVHVCKKKIGKRQGGFVNAVLRRILATSVQEILSDSPAHVQLGLPEIVCRRWQSRFDEESLQALALGLAQPAPLTCRALSSDVTAQLVELGGVRLPAFDWAEDVAFVAFETPGLLFKSGLVESGGIYIQDPSTLLAPSLLLEQKGTILDLCAAPGGKSVRLVANGMAELVVASDRSFRRQKRTADNLRAMDGDGNGVVVVSDLTCPAFKPGLADGVLLDVPCSNTGVYRRRPDALWRFSPEEHREVVALQSSLLAQSASLVRRGGTLVYSTCSIEIEENASQIQNFLACHDDFELAAERELLPGKHHDGGYAAKLRRT